jgi:hypothetical protein
MQRFYLRGLFALWIVFGMLCPACDGDGRPRRPDGNFDAATADGTLGDRAFAPDRFPADDASPRDGAPEPDVAVVFDSTVELDGTPGDVVPPLGGASGGSGGAVAPNGTNVTASGVSFILIVPNTYNAAVPNRAMIVYSGTEGASTMANNLLGVSGMANLSDVIFAVLDGVTYNGDAQAGATALDYVRTHYNISNDHTFLLSESAGTTAGLALGLDLRQSYFAAYWANDVNAAANPTQTAAQLGFAPWGNVGPGGDFSDANTIVNGMQAAGYRLPADAPYSGPGANTHGSTEQFLAAVQFFDGKSRQP